MRPMNAAKKANVSLNDATESVVKAARKRRLAAFRMWQKGHTFREVGEAFGVSRQRASQMVRRAESEFSPDYVL